MMKQFSLRKKRGNDHEHEWDPSQTIGQGDHLFGTQDGNTAGAGASPRGSISQQLADDASQTYDHLGLKVLHRPSGKRRADIIFVHGLGGNSRKTWTTSRDPSTFWPLQFLPQEPDIRDTRISTFGYNADFRAGSAKNKVSILDFSKDLLYDLKYAQDESEADACELRMGEKPIIFVVHSMGGLLVKEAYLQGQNDPIYQDIVKAITSMIFLSTPHRGTHLAETLNRILQVSFVTSPMQFIAELTGGSQTLQKINEQFRHVAPKLRIISFYETRPTSILKKTQIMVLEKDSSVLGYPGEISKPLDADHHGICKYESRTDPKYVTVRNALKSLIGTLDPSDGVGDIEVGMNTTLDIQSFLGITESPETDYNFFHDRWSQGTCSWILENEAFKSWINVDDRGSHFLWLHGNAASGKSVLSSFVIDHLVQSGLVCGFSFARYNDLKKRAPSFMMRSIACQLAAQIPTYAARLQELEAADTNLKTAHFRLVWQALYKQTLLQLSMDHPIYLILDGMDEAEHAGEFLKLLGDFQFASWPLRLLVVSRKTHEISSAWVKLGRQIDTETIPMEGNREDFRWYISQEMDMTNEDDEMFRDTLTQKLLHRARGNFLWLHLAVQKINACYTINEVEEALNNLPPGMENLYNRMADSVQAQTTKDGQRLGIGILGWVACAQRQLSIDELKDALSSEGLIEIHRTIGDLCGGFVVVDMGGKVSMVHETARQYLLRASLDVESEKPVLIDRKSTNMTLFERCYGRLMDPALRSLVARNKPPGLLNYAATYWFMHLSQCNLTDPRVLHTTAKFFKGPHVLTWISIIAAARELGTLVVASRYLADTVRKWRRSEHGMPLDFRRDIDIIEGWATDMVKIVGKFGDHLLKQPDSILKLIPPFCPETSMIYQQFGRKEAKSLQVTFADNRIWDDCLARFSMDEGFVASAVVTGGNYIAILATIRNASHIYLYNSHTFEKQRSIIHPERVFSIYLDPTGRILISYGYLTTRVWNTSNGECRQVAKNPTRRPRPHTIICCDEGRRLLVGSEDRCVRSLSLDGEDDETWTTVAQIEEQSLEDAVLNFPMCSALSPDGTMIAYGYRAYPMTVWELEPPNLIGQCSLELDSRDMTIQENTFGEVFRVAWHPLSDDREVFGLTQVGLLFKWSPYEESPSATVNSAAHNMAVSEDGVLITTGDGIGTVKVFATADLSMLYHLSSQDPVLSIIFSKDSRRLYDVRGSYGNVWQPNTLARIADTSEYPDHNSDAISEVESFAKSSLLPEHHAIRADSVITLAGQSLGSLYCYGTDDGVAVLCEIGRGKIMELERLTSFMPIEQVAWSENGKLICVAQLGGKLAIKKILQTKSEAEITVEQHSELQLPPDHGHITQLIFHRTRNQLLVATSSKLFLLDMDSGQLQQTSLSEGVRARWVSHSALPDHLLGFGSAKMYVYEWATLEQLSSETRTYFPPRMGSRTSTFSVGSSLHGTGAANTKAHRDVLGRVVSSDADSPNILLQLWSSDSSDQVTSTYLIFDVEEVANSCNGIGDESSPARSGELKQLSYTLLPPDVASCMREPLAFLSRRRLVFLDRDRWICTWRIPSSTNRAGRGPAPRGGGFRRGGGNAASSTTASANGVEAHYFLPSDWVTANEAYLCQVMTDGTLLCPRNGDVASVQCAKLRW